MSCSINGCIGDENAEEDDEPDDDRVGVERIALANWTSSSTIILLSVLFDRYSL
jgi:hypothetical protein